MSNFAHAPHLLPPPGPLSSIAHLKRRPRLATRLPWAVMATAASQSCRAPDQSAVGPQAQRRPRLPGLTLQVHIRRVNVDVTSVPEIVRRLTEGCGRNYIRWEGKTGGRM